MNRERVMESLTNRKYDEILATYLLLAPAEENKKKSQVTTAADITGYLFYLLIYIYHIN